MSAEPQMSAAGDAVEFPYRAVSRPAIASIIFFVLALPGLAPTFSALLALTVVGMIAAGVGVRATSRYPNEFSGRAVAVTGLALNALLLVGGIGEHVFIYLTEVPDGYRRVAFYQLQQDDGVVLDQPTETAMSIDGEQVFLKGYIHPASGSGMLRQFILVPDLGTCCFGGQPRSSDMIKVTLKGGQTVKAGLLKRKLAGTFIVNPVRRKVTDFDNPIFYRLRVDQIR